jgi:hypothetical protein
MPKHQEPTAQEQPNIGAGLLAPMAMDRILGDWSAEASTLFDELAAQNNAALERLKTCKDSTDVLKVEQAWVSARSRTFLESGVRFASVFANASSKLPA